MNTPIVERLLTELDRIGKGGEAYKGGAHSIMYVRQNEAQDLATQLRSALDHAWRYDQLSE